MILLFMNSETIFMIHLRLPMSDIRYVIERSSIKSQVFSVQSSLWLSWNKWLNFLSLCDVICMIRASGKYNPLELLQLCSDQISLCV